MFRKDVTAWKVKPRIGPSETLKVKCYEEFCLCWKKIKDLVF
jgi:hypothetical protein